MKTTVSMKLFRTLQQGKARLGKDALMRVVGFVESQRTADELFVNKNGAPDLYYTAFGWMLSYMLGIKTDVKKAAAYLDSLDTDELDLVHYAAYMRCRLIRQGKAGLLLKSIFAKEIRELETFGSVPHNDPQSPYSQFIRLSLLEDTGHIIRNKREIQRALAAYHVAGGGYTNAKEGLAATANATVAALAVKGQLEGYMDNADVGYLRNLQHPSGGFTATQESPIPELLSTATALFMLECYGIKPNYPAPDFVEAHWLDSGGFAATLLDEVSDVEYTFYGLLALGAAKDD